MLTICKQHFFLFRIIFEHDTHVAGIIAGSTYGIAPKSNIISVKVLDKKGNGNTDDIIKGIEWVIRNKQKYNIRIINISVGTLPKVGNNEKTKLVKCVDNAWNNGLVVVVAAGVGVIIGKMEMII